MTQRQADLMKMKICKIFKANKLSITIEVNLKVVNFLDITLDLNSGVYKPYMKPNDNPIYIHTKSNHPPAIIRNIPESVNRRLSSISKNEQVFKEAIPPYQEALLKSGFDYQLSYKPPASPSNNKKNRNRSKDVVWFNPPFSQNVSTNTSIS